MGNVGGEAGGTHFLLFGPRTPQPPSHPLPSPQAPLPPQASPTSTVPPRKSLLFSRLRDSRLAPTAPNLSRRVLQGLTHVGMEAEPPILSSTQHLRCPLLVLGEGLTWRPGLLPSASTIHVSPHQVPGPPAGTTAAPHSSLPPPPSTPRSVLLLQLPEMLPESAQTRPCFSEIYSSPSVYLELNLPPAEPVGEALPPKHHLRPPPLQARVLEPTQLTPVFPSSGDPLCWLCFLLVFTDSLPRGQPLP